MDKFIFEAHKISLKVDQDVLFSNLSFGLKPGQTCLVTGPNGSGKSTILRLCAGLMSPSSGTFNWDTPSEIRYQGHQLGLKGSHTIKNIFQTNNNIQDPFGVHAWDNLNVQMLSEGMKKKVALTRTLQNPGQLCILDEPNTSLDKDSQKILLAWIAHHQNHGVAFILSTTMDFAIKPHVHIALS